MLATPMAKDLGIAAPTVFAAFSLALLGSAALGPYAGRAIDRWGGRPVLIGTNLVFAIGLATLGLANGPGAMFAGWVVIGIGMGSGLYEAAFAALVRLYGRDARNAITGVTLFAGFASTVGWPLTTLLLGEVGWRGACFAWAALHLVLGMPLNASLPKAAALHVFVPVQAADPKRDTEPPPRLRVAVVLSFVFAATWFASTAMAAHLPRLLQAGGATLATAVAIGALVGPAQVAGRLLEFGVLRRIHPLFSARLAALMPPLGAILLMAFGAPAAALFAILHGAGNGIITIAKGTLPLALFGPQGYGQRQGILMVPARIAQALAPWLFGVLLDRWGVRAMAFTAALGLAAFAALMFLPKSRDEPERTSPTA